MHCEHNPGCDHRNEVTIMDVPGQPVPDERETTPDFFISASELDRHLTEIEGIITAWEAEGVQVKTRYVLEALRHRLGLPDA